MEPRDSPVDIISCKTCLIADVAVDGAHGTGSGGALSYEVPATLSHRVNVGHLVWVPLRKQMVLGLCVGLREGPDEIGLRAVSSPVEPAFELDANQLETVFWLSRETSCSIFAAA